MVFSSLVFLFVFLPIVLGIYYIIPKKFRNLFLLMADFIFYGWGEPVLVFLMIFTIVFNYFTGIIISKKKSSSENSAKSVLIITTIVDLGLLVFFKYAGLITNTINIIIPVADIKIMEIPLPIGISFYTFQILSYVIDVYRNDTPVQKNIISFGTYVTLFPQLIAGPIVRYKDINNQLSDRKENIEMFSKGVKIFVVGLAKKVLLANQLGLLWDNLRSASDSGYIGCWVGLLSYSLQIYFDFSGYSDMAIGLGNMFGFEFLKNFNYPYISKSITEFWRRWHISLGTWFREYVYIPLGGNRKNKVRTYINIIVVWALTGMWHGASWNFMLWGLYFGVILIIEKLFLLKSLEKAPNFIGHIYSLIIIYFGWLLFYYSDDVGGISCLVSYFINMFTGNALSLYSKNTIIHYIPILIIGIAASTPAASKIYNKIKEYKFTAFCEPVFIVVMLILCISSLVNNTYNPFLYFKF